MKLNGNLQFLGGGQLTTLRVDNLATDPASPVNGQVWYNTVGNVLKYFDGTQVQQIAIGGNLSAYVKHDGTVAMTGQLTLKDSLPIATTDAASKGYVDTKVGDVTDPMKTTADGTATSAGLTLNATTRVVTYTADATADYIAGATSLANADSLLDDQIKTNTTNIGTNTTSIETLTSTKVAKAGDTMTGNLVFSNSARITGLLTPVAATEPVTKAYAEALVAGLDFQADVLAIQIDATLNPTATPAAGARYILTNIAALHANFGTIAGVANGDVVEYVGSAFVVNYDVSVAGSGALVWNRDAVRWEYWNGTSWGEFGGLAGITTGVGLEKTGNTIFINMGAGIAQLPSDEVGLDILSTGGLFLTIDSATASTDTAAKLSILLDGGTLQRSASGLKISDSGVGASQIAVGAIANGLQGAAGTAISVKADTGITVGASGVGVDTTWGDARYATLIGATFTGAVNLPAADPTADTNAAHKGYIDSKISTVNTTISNLATRLGNCFYVYDGSVASDTHSVTHSIGSRYCNVTVVDYSTNEVVIPQSITFDSTTALTVTFGSSVACRVVVSGLKPAA